MADQQQAMQLLWFALYFLIGMGVLAGKSTAKGAPAAWSPAGMLRRMHRSAEKDRDLDEGLSSYPAAMAFGIAFAWVATVLAWPLLLTLWAVSSVRRFCSRS